MAAPAVAAAAAKAGALRKLAPLLGVLALLVLAAPLSAIFIASAFFSDAQQAVCQSGQTVGVADPPSISALEIAQKIYVAADDMELGRRYVLAAYIAVLWESGGGVTMTNPQGGDRTSTGSFQQQNFSPWTDHGRNRDNVSDAARSFFEQARKTDRAGWTPGELAVNTQLPDETLRYRYTAPETQARAEQFLTAVQEAIGPGAADSEETPATADPDDLSSYVLSVGGAGAGAASDAACGVYGAPGAVGPADLNQAVRIDAPGQMAYLPRWATSTGYTSTAIHDGRAMADSRIIPAVLWMLRRYNLRVHDCLASGHNTHGAGESCDIVPADDPFPQPGRMTPGWANVTRLAHDLGWVQPGPGYAGGYSCNSGYPFKPAIYIVCYNGDSNHGDPDHITGSCACPHVHITFQSPIHGAPTALPSPPPWVMTFPVPDDDGGQGDDGSSDDAQQGPVRVDIVGDSLAVGTQTALPNELGDAYRVRTDARVGRPLREGLGIIDGLQPLPDVLAVSLFTNDDPASVDALRDGVRQSTQHVRDGGCVVWSTIAAPAVGGRSYGAANQALRSIAADNTRVVVIDWARYVADHPGVLGPDSIHPTPAGYRVRASLYAQGIESCAS